MWKVLRLASFNPLGPVVFVEVGALIIREGTAAYIIKCVIKKKTKHNHKAYLSYSFSYPLMVGLVIIIKSIVFLGKV